MSKKLTLDDLIIEEHPGGQNCRSCPLYEPSEPECELEYGYYDELNASLTDEFGNAKCLTHTITLKPTTDEQL